MAGSEERGVVEAGAEGAGVGGGAHGGCVVAAAPGVGSGGALVAGALTALATGGGKRRRLAPSKYADALVPGCADRGAQAAQSRGRGGGASGGNKVVAAKGGGRAEALIGRGGGAKGGKKAAKGGGRAKSSNAGGDADGAKGAGCARARSGALRDEMVVQGAQTNDMKAGMNRGAFSVADGLSGSSDQSPARVRTHACRLPYMPLLPAPPHAPCAEGACAQQQADPLPLWFLL